MRRLNPRSALSLLPGWDTPDVEIQPLPGGLNNRTFKVERGSETLVLRLDENDALPFWLDRGREVKIHRRAAQAGLAPDVILADAGVLITRFVGGRNWSPADLGSHRNIDHATDLLREVHALPSSGSGFEGLRIAEEYLSGLVGDPDRRKFAERCVAAIKAAPAFGDVCCCHNDVVAANLVGQPRPMLVDWEYACDNDPFFDLASLLAYHGIGETLSQAWLSAFAGGNSPELRERLAAQRRIFNALHWLWLAMRQSVNPDQEQARVLHELQLSFD
jgi:thiamine kinase-like enzyme